MSRYERYSSRSLVYSKWHRFYLGDREPMIDLDGVEYCPERGCGMPLVLIETARDIGQSNKPTTVLRNLARVSNVIALCALYTVSDGVDDQRGCACEPQQVKPGCDHGISGFRVRRISPPQANPNGWTRMSPEEFRDRLREVRMDHMHSVHHLWNGAAERTVARKP